MEKAFFEEIHGKQVFCILSQPQSPSKKMVIMSHGFRGNSTGYQKKYLQKNIKIIYLKKTARNMKPPRPQLSFQAGYLPIQRFHASEGYPPSLFELRWGAPAFHPHRKRWGIQAKGHKGPLHLVYGQEDMFVSERLRERVIHVVREKGQQVMILKGQNHSRWDYDVCQQVYKIELGFIKKYLH